MQLLQPGEDPALPGAVRPPAPSVTLPRTSGCASAQREALSEQPFESAPGLRSRRAARAGQAHASLACGAPFRTGDPGGAQAGLSSLHGTRPSAEE